MLQKNIEELANSLVILGNIMIPASVSWTGLAHEKADSILEIFRSTGLKQVHFYLSHS